MKKPHLESTYKLFINGEWKEASDKATYKSYCPANGEVLPNVHRRPEKMLRTPSRLPGLLLKPGRTSLSMNVPKS